MKEKNSILTFNIDTQPFIVETIISKMFKDVYLEISSDELKDRIVEFEVIKEGLVDFISLEHFFDFYNVKFIKSTFDLQYDIHHNFISAAVQKYVTNTDPI